ncbi:MAG TPA: phosphoribosyltransferase family protein [Ktedonobacterales bacterium]|nr:phosphoribosyltransferase family protein [Ktedonobacterales bacterium]
MERTFRDRTEAGAALARQLMRYASRSDVLVLGLPRGGVPVAFIIARALHAPMDIMLVRKLGVPGQEELALGAIASGGSRVLNAVVVQDLGIPEQVIEAVTAREQRELARREHLYRGNLPGRQVQGQAVILVDDGLATGATMRVAITALRAQQPAWIVVVVPVAPPSVCQALRAIADEVVCLLTPEPFLGVGRWYDDFSPVTDEEVRWLLERATQTQPHKLFNQEEYSSQPQKEARSMSSSLSAQRPERLAYIPAEGVRLEGLLSLPEGAPGVVIFAHGSGSSRHSPRNRLVASALQEGGLGTLLLDLLTPEEEALDQQTGQYRFDISLLANRLISVAEWLTQMPETSTLGLGYFGASTGAGAALLATARQPAGVQAIVSRGGRPDLAGPALAQVEAPTLLIVGSKDIPVLAMNREALASLPGEKKLEIIPGATHLFEEPGTLEQVARIARQWFQYYLRPRDQPGPAPFQAADQAMPELS